MDSEGLHLKKLPSDQYLKIIQLCLKSDSLTSCGKAQKGFLIFSYDLLEGKSKRKLIDGEGKNHKGCEFIGGGMGREGSKTR